MNGGRDVMKIMLDTNILISAGLFPSKKMTYFLEQVTKHNRILLCTYCLEELKFVIIKKFPNKHKNIEMFLQKLPFSLVRTHDSNLKRLNISIRDEADYPVLMPAILADVDILITGDKDFVDIKIKKPEIMSPTEFLERYSQFP